MATPPRLRAPDWRIKTPPRRIAPPPTEGGFGGQHYKSREHRDWASAVKRRDGYTCQSCGANGADVRLVADHIKELRDGGASDLANGLTLCLACHNRKTGKEKTARGKEQYAR